MFPPTLGKNFAETQQFEDLSVNYFFFFITCTFLCRQKLISFLLHAYFCENHPELVSNAFFMNVEKKKLKTFCGKKVLVCSKCLKGAPSNTLKLFSTKCFFYCFSLFIKNAFGTNSGLFSQKYARNKKEINF